MGFVAAKCTQCGANIEVDESKEAGICRHCGTAFVTEKAIQKYAIENVVHNHIANANIQKVVLREEADLSELFKRFYAFMRLDRYAEAKRESDKMYEAFPYSGLTHLCRTDWLATVYDEGQGVYDFADMEERLRAFDEKSDEYYLKKAKETPEYCHYAKNGGFQWDLYRNACYFIGKVDTVKSVERNVSVFMLDEINKEINRSFSLALEMLTEEEKRMSSDYLEKVRKKVLVVDAVFRHYAQYSERLVRLENLILNGLR